MTTVNPTRVGHRTKDIRTWLLQSAVSKESYSLQFSVFNLKERSRSKCQSQEFSRANEPELSIKELFSGNSRSVLKPVCKA